MHFLGVWVYSTQRAIMEKTKLSVWDVYNTFLPPPVNHVTCWVNTITERQPRLSHGWENSIQIYTKSKVQQCSRVFFLFLCKHIAAPLSFRNKGQGTRETSQHMGKLNTKTQSQNCTDCTKTPKMHLTTHICMLILKRHTHTRYLCHIINFLSAAALLCNFNWCGSTTCM